MSDKVCDDCGKPLGNKYYQDVPNKGDLCLECHGRWFGKDKMSEKKPRKKLCIDFDGVLHSYESGWQGVDVIPDPPVPGALRWLREMILHPDMEPIIYSSRSKDLNGISAMKTWLFDNGMRDDEIAELQFPMEKPAAWLTIDDRCFHFQGEFPSAEFINSFKPWNKQ